MKWVGLDIGTTSICGVVLDTEGGGLLASITRRNDADIPGSNPWERMQNPERIVVVVNAVLEELLLRHPDVQGIGITGQMHGIVYTDATGKHVSPLYTWQDQRGALPYSGSGVGDSLGVSDNGKRNSRDGVYDVNSGSNDDGDHRENGVNQHISTYAEQFSERIGYRVQPGYGLATHTANQALHLVPSTARYMCTIADYAAMRIGGGTIPRMDSSQAASMGAFSLDDGDFDREVLASAGLETAMLPEIVSGGTVVGQYRSSIPVYVAIGDNQASFLGAVANISDSVLVNIGTGGQVSIYTDSLMEIPGMETRPFPGGGYLLVGASLCGGKSYAMLERFFRDVIYTFTGENGLPLYERMNEIAESYGSTAADPGLTVDPRFLGTRNEAGPGAGGVISGITLDNWRTDALAFAFLDGMAEELRSYYAAVPKTMTTRIRRLIGSGNGVRLNRVLSQRLSARFGLPLELPPFEEEGAVGAALCAAVGAGCLPSFASAGQCLE